MILVLCCILKLCTQLLGPSFKAWLNGSMVTKSSHKVILQHIAFPVLPNTRFVSAYPVKTRMHLILMAHICHHGTLIISRSNCSHILKSLQKTYLLDHMNLTMMLFFTTHCLWFSNIPSGNTLPSLCLFMQAQGAGICVFFQPRPQQLRINTNCGGDSLLHQMIIIQYPTR